MIFLNRDNAGPAAVFGAIFLSSALVASSMGRNARADVIVTPPAQEEMVPVPRSIVERTAAEIAGMQAMIEALMGEVAKRDHEIKRQKSMSCA